MSNVEATFGSMNQLTSKKETYILKEDIDDTSYTIDIDELIGFA